MVLLLIPSKLRDILNSLKWRELTVTLWHARKKSSGGTEVQPLDEEYEISLEIKLLRLPKTAAT